MSTSIGNKVCLYELALQDGRSASPFVWRIRYALAHKGIPFDTVYLGFTEIPTVFGGKFKTVPILEHAGTARAESWDIAEHLDRAFPRQPLLFNSPAELSLVRFMDAWFMSEVLRKMFRLYVKDVHDAARPEDRRYFRESREKKMKGKTLETFTADRASAMTPCATGWIGASICTAALRAPRASSRCSSEPLAIYHMRATRPMGASCCAVAKQQLPAAAEPR
jgi:glutathione S-transferase